MKIWSITKAGVVWERMLLKGNYDGVIRCQEDSVEHLLPPQR